MHHVAMQSLPALTAPARQVPALRSVRVFGNAPPDGGNGHQGVVTGGAPLKSDWSAA